MAVIGLLVFNVVLEVFINFTNINRFSKLCECVCVGVHVCMYVSQYEVYQKGFIRFIWFKVIIVILIMFH